MAVEREPPLDLLMALPADALPEADLPPPKAKPVRETNTVLKKADTPLDPTEPEREPLAFPMTLKPNSPPEADPPPETDPPLEKCSGLDATPPQEVAPQTLNPKKKPTLTSKPVSRKL